MDNKQHYIISAVITCYKPTTPVNGAYTPIEADDQHDFNTTVTFTCDNGYWHSGGNLEIRCTEFATWDIAPAVCSSTLTYKRNSF